MAKFLKGALRFAFMVTSCCGMVFLANVIFGGIGGWPGALVFGGLHGLLWQVAFEKSGV
jgi:hypothetical protein